MSKKPPLAWGKKVSQAFRDRLYEGCAGMGWGPQAPSFLMACMAFESAETFSPSIKNFAGSSGTGLIQFMSFTAKSLGTTTARLAAMPAEEQLKWVFKYFDQYPKLKKRDVTLGDIYMAILKPKYIGAPDSASIIVTPAEYRPNKGLDRNKDGKITKAEAAAEPAYKLAKGLLPKFAFVE